ncbi:MAG: efflux RND transporter permease subunit [Verrucomicrobia subdivision 3 bacterium]|nr:efflux RND transporter permease subunit [Limisphaerales bacterium]
MILPRISIQRPILASMMSLALVLFGLISLQRLPVRELPDIDPPIVSVMTVYPGANAAVVETEITERLEEAVNNIEGIKTLSSQSREQVSTITIEFDLSRDIDLAAQDVRDRVSRARGLLPDFIDEPIIAKQDADAFPIIWLGLNSDRYSTLELTTLAEKQIKNRFQTVRGVSSVMIGGEQRFAMRLWLDSEKMAAHQVTVLDVQQALREQNIELPSGRVEGLDREMTIETRGELKTADEFNRLVVKNTGVKIVRLLDIGQAREGVENERTVARNNGKPCVFLGIIKQSKANTVEVAHGIKDEMERIKPTLPAGVEMVVNYDSSRFVERAIEEVWVTLGIAFVLVVIIIYLFLRDFRSTIIPAVAIPVSIVGTFSILQAFGYSVNILTMLALVLAIGVVVDDAIVVLENIFRHIEQGVQPMKAAFKAMDEIAFAIIAITISLVAVFLPLAFQTSTTGRLFIEFAVAVAGSVIISAFVALTLTPMMAARILKETHQTRHNFVIRGVERLLTALNNGYRRVLSWSLAHRFPVLLVAVGSFALMVITYRALEHEFLPDEDRGLLLCVLAAPEGSTTEYTARMGREVEAILASTPEVRLFGGIVAPAFSGPGQPNNAIFFIHFKEDRKRSVQEIVNAPDGLRNKLLTQVEGALAFPSLPKAFTRGINAPFNLVIQAQDLGALDKYTSQLVNKLRGEPWLQNVRPSFEVNKPELRLNIDRDRATALGVSIEDISRTLQILFGGLDLSRIKIGGKEYEVIAQLERASRLTPQALDQLYVRNAAGGLVQLSSVVSYRSGSAPNTIEHYNRLRSATISATPVGVPLGTAVRRVEAMLTTDLPIGFLYDWSGESRDLRDAGQEVWFVLILALIIVYMVLAAQYESLVHPITVILAVPLAGLGALGLLWLVDYLGKAGIIPVVPAMNINLFSQIGLVLLVGLVTKNSILLVEFANQQRAHGVDSHEAMLQAGIVRLRPILMTAFSTVAGILPIAIGFGAGAESRRPMGVAVVGGLLTSTFLTLIIIPVVYTLFSDFAAWMREKFSRSKSQTPLPDHPITVGK